MSGGRKTIILEHRGWLIERDSCGGYIVREKDDSRLRHALYPSPLKSALKTLYRKRLAEKANEEDYKASLADLQRIIEETDEEFEALLGKPIKEMTDSSSAIETSGDEEDADTNK